MQFTKIHQDLAKPVYEAIPKIAEKAGKKWKWEPEIRDQFYTVDYPEKVLYVAHFGTYWLGNPAIEDEERQPHCIKDCIPLLHWERIVKILENVGYDVTVTYEGGEELDKRGYCNIWKDGEYKIEDKRGKDCQEAVQRAVLALVEELR